MNRKLWAVAAAGFTLSGCAVRTTGRVPQVSPPAAYSAAAADATLRAETADLTEWWKSFND